MKNSDIYVALIKILPKVAWGLLMVAVVLFGLSFLIDLLAHIVRLGESLRATLTLFVWLILAAFGTAYAIKMAASTRRSLNVSLFLAGLFLFSVALFIVCGFSVYYVQSGMFPESVEGALSAHYFSLVTFTTLGYGDISPKGVHRLVASFEALVGYLYFGVVAGVFGGVTVNSVVNARGRE